MSAVMTGSVESHRSQVARFQSCTLTGASEDVDLSRLEQLSRHYPFVEWAILYSPSRAGWERRYPSVAWIEKFIERVNGAGMCCALHLCGDAVDEFVFRRGTGYDLSQSFDRIQLNFNVVKKPRDLAILAAAVNASHRPIITQANEDNGLVAHSILARRHHLLFDSSGGRGIDAREWPRPVAGKIACGYAGGLGPHNIVEQLPRIAAVSEGALWWIDMEGKIRTAEDMFDLEAAEAVLSAVQRWMQGGGDGR